MRGKILLIGFILCAVFGCKKGTKTCATFIIPNNEMSGVAITINGASILYPNYRKDIYEYYYYDLTDIIISAKRNNYKVDTIYGTSLYITKNINENELRFKTQYPKGIVDKSIVDCDNNVNGNLDICCNN